MNENDIIIHMKQRMILQMYSILTLRLTKYFLLLNLSFNLCQWMQDHMITINISNFNSLCFAPITSADVEERIPSLKNKPGNINTFSTSVLKRIRLHVSNGLCHIINVSLRCGIFPDCFKLGRVTPIPKVVIQLMLAWLDQATLLYLYS